MHEVELYISKFDEDIQIKLNMLRQAVTQVVAEAEERMCMGTISYRLYHKWFIHFAAFKKHIGFYPDSDTIIAFKDQLQAYKTSTGTVQFPLDKDLPMDLIHNMIVFKYKALQKYQN